MGLAGILAALLPCQHGCSAEGQSCTDADMKSMMQESLPDHSSWLQCGSKGYIPGTSKIHRSIPKTGTGQTEGCHICCEMIRAAALQHTQQPIPPVQVEAPALQLQ